ncbi:MAG: type II toxin-antitoxin system VapC family toxin, partial [Candidatus Dormibacteria bacterium]
MILIDTHAWLWFRSSPDRLPERARRLIQTEPLAVSTISCWEVATLVRLGRLGLDRDVNAWVVRALVEEPPVTAIPVSREIAVTAGGLRAPFPGDPADRLILSTAVALRCPLLTRDHRLRTH